MKKIQMTSKVLGAILLAYLCMHLYIHTATNYTHIYELKPFTLFGTGTISTNLTYTYQDIVATSPALKHLAFAVSFLANLLLLAAGFIVFLILRNFASGKILHQDNVPLLQKSAKWLFAGVLFAPIQEMISSYAFSAYKGEGNRILSVSISSQDIEKWLLVAGLFIISWILKEAVMLQQEDGLVI